LCTGVALKPGRDCCLSAEPTGRMKQPSQLGKWVLVGEKKKLSMPPSYTKQLLDV